MPEKREQTWFEWLTGRSAESPTVESVKKGAGVAKKANSLEALQKASREALERQEAEKRKKFNAENRKAAYGQ